MRDDYIQGILFSRTSHIDLRRMSTSERATYKMLATKNSLKNWSNTTASSIDSRARQITVRRRGK